MKNRDVARVGLFILGGAAISTLLVSQTTRRRHDEPEHTISQTDGAIEIRSYAPIITAQVEIEGSRLKAIKRGFRIVAGFIFGDNEGRKRIEMTTPVIQHLSETEASNSALAHGQHERGTWTIQFVMPDQYTLDTLPQPNNPLVSLKATPARQMAAIRFSGSPKDRAKIAAKAAELEEYILSQGLETRGGPLLAFYDPPWTIPSLRRNEVMFEVTRASQKAEPKQAKK